MLSVPELFRRASIEMRGPVPWGSPVNDTSSGVYVIALAETAANFTQNLSEDQLKRWNADQEIIYIGRATRLRKRIAQFYRHEYGRSSPHRGGQDIKLLTGLTQLYWGDATDFANAEKTMIDAFRNEVGALPFGNRMRSAQKRALSN
ncbi:GIY-YIG nuclease family protein [Hyphomicrobium sp. ghe19]|uniref:GIY-YIG nuclease family protein n=1 Tax=Hyphomicrobium sp. ghe19 TaxID=2682968 RepID=UPI0013671861|nr:hypothetical protein HYPP_02021 [Hyphomicrobium sp. ghe19]